MQKRFVKKALTNLTDKLCESPQKNSKHLKTRSNFNDTQFRTNDIPDTPNDFCRLSLNYMNKGVKLDISESNDNEKENDIFLKPFFRDQQRDSNIISDMYPQSDNLGCSFKLTQDQKDKEYDDGL